MVQLFTDAKRKTRIRSVMCEEDALILLNLGDRCFLIYYLITMTECLPTLSSLGCKNDLDLRLMVALN